MKKRLALLVLACLVLPVLILSKPASAQQDVWYAPTWGEVDFDENFPIAYVSTEQGSIIVQLMAETLQWKTTVVVASAQRDMHLVNILSHANGSSYKLHTQDIEGGIPQDPHESGGLITTFFLDQTFVNQAKTADSWTVHVGLDRFVFPMKGSRTALDHVETVGYESNHAFAQEDSDMEQALHNCGAAAAHAHDRMSPFFRCRMGRHRPGRGCVAL